MSGEKQGKAIMSSTQMIRRASLAIRSATKEQLRETLIRSLDQGRFKDHSNESERDPKPSK